MYSVEHPVDTAGSYYLLVIITRKSGTFRDHTQICHRHVLVHLFIQCQKGKERLLGTRTKRETSRDYWRWSASAFLEETPIFTFPEGSVANYLFSFRTHLKFRFRIRGEGRMELKCVLNLSAFNPCSPLNHLSSLLVWSTFEKEDPLGIPWRDPPLLSSWLAWRVLRSRPTAQSFSSFSGAFLADLAGLRQPLSQAVCLALNCQGAFVKCEEYFERVRFGIRHTGFQSSCRTSGSILAVITPAVMTMS